MALIKRFGKKTDNKKTPVIKQDETERERIETTAPSEEKPSPAQTRGRDTMISFRRSMYSSKMIGSAEDLIPFAWRQPLKLADKKKMSRVFKAMAAEQVERELMMPVKQD